MKLLIKILYGILLSVAVICSVSCGASETTKESEDIDYKAYFAEYDKILGLPTALPACMSYDAREMELQIDGFWEYYERYQTALQNLNQTIQEWEADFIGEGTYIVGRDLPEGKYVFCNPNGDDNDDENAISTRNKINTSYTDIFHSPYFSVIELQTDDVVKVIGNPQFAPLDQFPEFSVSEDGNYYGKYYKVGKNIPAGVYMVLSMDTKAGNLSLGVDAEPSGGFFIGAPRTRFMYTILVDSGDSQQDNYVKLDDCILIPIEKKPTINPIFHEDITYKNKDATAVDILRILSGKETTIERTNYSQPIYAQGDYIIGDDLPLGTYQIQCEIAWEISDRDSEEYQSDYISIDSGNYDYSWSGLEIYYQHMAEQCGWKAIRLGIWGGGIQRVGVKDPEGNMSGYTVYEGELPSITFTEKDRGAIISVVRAILIPAQE